MLAFITPGNRWKSKCNQTDWGCMAQYYFRTANDAGGPSGDPLEFESAEDARRQAVLFTSEMLRERPDVVWHDDVRLDVTTEEGLILFTIVRRQNIRHRSGRRLAECGPRLGLDVRRPACGAASADIRWSVV